MASVAKMNHRAGLHLQFVPQGSGLFQHKVGIAMPAGLASGGTVVQAGQIGLRSGAHQHVGADVGQQVGPGGRADLVVNDLERRSLLGQAQHGFGEIAAARAIHPAGTHNKVLGVGGHGQVAGQLALAVDAQGRAGSAFAPRLCSAAVVHIVAREMN